MDAITAVAPTHEDPRTPTFPAPSHAERALAVTASYALSEQGRKVSLLTGGDGLFVQHLTVQVPPNRLHLVSVDNDGVARLRLRPRYEHDEKEHIARIDAPPTFDAPPDLETLFQQAARNHQLELAYDAQRRAERAKRRDASREQRAQLAQAFLADPERRAIVHPAPTPKRCALNTDHGLVLFDVTTDDDIAREVPPEAHRRFRADLRARADRAQHERAAQLAVHEEKKRLIAEWVAAHGTPEQQSRQAAGMLPMDEAIEAIIDDAFAVLKDWPRYTRDGVAQLEAHLRRFSQYAEAVITTQDLIVTSTNAAKASAPQWARIQEAQALLPDASVVLRVHRLAWVRNRQVPALSLFALLITQRRGPLTLRREYEVHG